MTPARIVLTLFSIRFGRKSGLKNISNKTARSKKISKKVNLQKNLNKKISYKNIT